MKYNFCTYRTLILVRYVFQLAIPTIYNVKTPTVSNNFIFRKRETKQLTKKRERRIRDIDTPIENADYFVPSWWIASSSAAMDVLWVKRELAIARADRVADGCIIAFRGMPEAHRVVAEHYIGCRRDPNGNICGIARLRFFESHRLSLADAFVAFVVEITIRFGDPTILALPSTQRCGRADFETRHSIMPVVKWNKTKCHSKIIGNW